MTCREQSDLDDVRPPSSGSHGRSVGPGLLHTLRPPCGARRWVRGRGRREAGASAAPCRDRGSDKGRIVKRERSNCGYGIKPLPAGNPATRRGNGSRARSDGLPHRSAGCAFQASTPALFASSVPRRPRIPPTSMVFFDLDIAVAERHHQLRSGQTMLREHRAMICALEKFWYASSAPKMRSSK